MQRMSPVFSLILLLSVLISGCKVDASKEYSVLVSMYYPNNSYQHWLLHFDSTLTFHQAYGMFSDSLNKILAEVDGMILTGGKGIHPSFYGQGAAIAQ